MRELHLIPFVIVLLLLSACKTKEIQYVPVPQVQIRDSVITRIQRDSVYLRDSVFVDRWAKGDTVYVEKTAVRFVYKDKVHEDTIFVYRTDSVTIPVAELSSSYDKEQSWFDSLNFADKIFVYLFGGFVLCSALSLVCALLREYLENRK